MDADRSLCSCFFLAVLLSPASEDRSLELGIAPASSLFCVTSRLTAPSSVENGSYQS